MWNLPRTKWNVRHIVVISACTIKKCDNETRTKWNFGHIAVISTCTIKKRDSETFPKPLK